MSLMKQIATGRAPTMAVVPLATEPETESENGAAYGPTMDGVT